MLDTNQIAAASRTLVSHWRSGSKFDASMPQSVRARLTGEQHKVQEAGDVRTQGFAGKT